MTGAGGAKHSLCGHYDITPTAEFKRDVAAVLFALVLLLGVRGCSPTAALRGGGPS